MIHTLESILPIGVIHRPNVFLQRSSAFHVFVVFVVAPA